jgi:hypothetical protein
MPAQQTIFALAILSNIKKAMEAIKSWDENRDRYLTLLKLNDEQGEINKEQPDVIKEADQLSMLVSDESLKASFDRIDSFYAWYQTVLCSPQFIDKEVDEATKALINCICRELQKLNIINEETPDGILKNYWREYSSDYLKVYKSSL